MQIQSIPLSQVAFDMAGLELCLTQIEFLITSHTPTPIASEKYKDWRSFEGFFFFLFWGWAKCLAQNGSHGLWGSTPNRCKRSLWVCQSHTSDTAGHQAPAGPLSCFCWMIKPPRSRPRTCLWSVQWLLIEVWVDFGFRGAKKCSKPYVLLGLFIISVKWEGQAAFAHVSFWLSLSTLSSEGWGGRGIWLSWYLSTRKRGHLRGNISEQEARARWSLWVWWRSRVTSQLPGSWVPCQPTPLQSIFKIRNLSYCLFTVEDFGIYIGLCLADSFVCHMGAEGWTGIAASPIF